MKRFWIVLAALSLLIVMIGCGEQQNDPPRQETGQTDTAEAAAAEQADTVDAGAVSADQPSAQEEERVIRHVMGEVTLKGTPERVVVLFNGMTDIVTHLGVKPVGAVESWDEKPWFLYLRDNMDGVKNLGSENQPNLEAVVALQPDLILVAEARHEDVYNQLSAIAPTIVVEDLFDWKKNLTLAAEALNKQEEAANILRQWDERVVDFKSKMGDRAAQTEVSIIRFQKDGSSRVYASGFAGLILEELGVARPEAQRFQGKTTVTLTTKEQIPQLDGDYIFDITTRLDGEMDSTKSQTDWTANPLWSQLKGVQNGHYYMVNPIVWNLAGGSMAAQLLVDDLYTYFGLE